MTILDYYWKSNPEWVVELPNGMEKVKDTAPEEAKRSYEHYIKQLHGDIS